MLLEDLGQQHSSENLNFRVDIYLKMKLRFIVK